MKVFVFYAILPLLVLGSRVARAIPVVPAQDMSELCSMTKPAQYYRPEAALADLAKLGQTLSSTDAIVKIEVQAIDGGKFGCTGTYISDAGHLLTARHCFEHCTTLDPENCAVFVNGVKVDFNFAAINACTHGEMMRARLREPDAKRECIAAGDLVVLKLPELEASAKCLPLSHSTIGSQSQSVYTIGFPSKTTRFSRKGDPRDSQGTDVRVSYGSIVSSDTCVDLKTKQKRKLDPYVIELRPHYIQTSVDIVPGSSGGALIDRNGEVIGVASFFSNDVHNDKNACLGAQFFDPVSRLDATAQLAGLPFHSSDLVCKSRRVGAGGI